MDLTHSNEGNDLKEGKNRYGAMLLDRSSIDSLLGAYFLGYEDKLGWVSSAINAFRVQSKPFKGQSRENGN